MTEWLDEFAAQFKPYVCDIGTYLTAAAKEGKNIMFEAQLGALRDIDFGIYPYTSSSNTISAYAPIGAGVPNLRIDKTVGIMKAYSTCVGEGPFTAEMFGEEAVKLREAGGEYGAATGRPRRVGGFDVVASRYGCRVQAADEVALTKLDILDNMDRIPVVDAYEIDGELVTEFPFGESWSRQNLTSCISKVGSARRRRAELSTNFPPKRARTSNISKKQSERLSSTYPSERNATA